MTTQEMTTTDLADFGYRERCILQAILTCWNKDGLPDGFYDDEVRPMMNRNSGHVFLTNAECQVAMINGTSLEIWHHCGNCGHEGFEDDCQIDIGADCCNQCTCDD